MKKEKRKKKKKKEKEKRKRKRKRIERVLFTWKTLAKIKIIKE